MRKLATELYTGLTFSGVQGAAKNVSEQILQRHVLIFACRKAVYNEFFGPPKHPEDTIVPLIEEFTK